MEKENEKMGFMEHHDGYPVSRDWEDIDCSAVRCLNNMSGKCGIPSIAKIDEEGRCMGFIAIEYKNREIPKD